MHLTQDSVRSLIHSPFHSVSFTCNTHEVIQGRFYRRWFPLDFRYYLWICIIKIRRRRSVTMLKWRCVNFNSPGNIENYYDTYHFTYCIVEKKKGKIRKFTRRTKSYLMVRTALRLAVLTIVPLTHFDAHSKSILLKKRGKSRPSFKESYMFQSDINRISS